MAAVIYNRCFALRSAQPLPEPRSKHRRWNVIISGLLIATLSLIVTFTSRTAFLSPAAVVVLAAVGLIALLLQLRFRYRDIATGVHVPMWLNLLGILFALAAFFADVLHLRPGVAEVIALVAVGCFGISGAIVLHEVRKRRATPK